jgi:hypothetical protein
MDFDIRHEYLCILFNPPKKLLEDRKYLRFLRSRALKISEADIYDNILYIQSVFE